MLSLPLVLLSLHALAVYSAPSKDSDDAAVLRRGGMIHGLTLRREEYHQLQKRAAYICNIPARDAANGDCTKRYPSSLRKRGRGSKKKPGYYTEQSGSSSGNGESSSPSQYSDHTSSTQQRQDEQDDQDMAEYEDQQATGNHCDHLVELQVVAEVLYPYCTNPGISDRRATNIKNYLNHPDHNLYLIRGDVNLAKGAATKRAILRARDGRSLTYASNFDQSTWIGVVQYLEAKLSVAHTNAGWIKSATGLTTTNIDDEIYALYTDTIRIAKAMRDSYIPSQQASQQTSQQGSSGGNSPHHSEGSGTSSSLSDPPAESTRTYHGRPVTVYSMHGEDYYAHWNGHAYVYEVFKSSNLRRFPPVYQQ